MFGKKGKVSGLFKIILVIIAVFVIMQIVQPDIDIPLGNQCSYGKYTLVGVYDCPYGGVPLNECEGPLTKEKFGFYCQLE